jgi:class 3 adenylate cyclase/tetratricopeptide (TPR) repeat protein
VRPDPRAYTPVHLAEKMLRQRAELEGERRTVTVLFVDAVDSTPLAERLGEEEMYSLMQGCMSRMMDAVHHYEGHVASFTGDGIMAVFGAPIAHEESERRAVAAALRMQRTLEEHGSEIEARHGVSCRFRVGLNTGSVVVGKVSDELTMEFTAIGDTVNLAARVEALAEPGTVYLTEATYRPVADYFDAEALGAKQVKGKSQPVTVYRAVREKPLRTRFQVAAERGLAPFVGRENDLVALEHQLSRVCQGHGEVVSVSGEAGLGKSRLLAEFRRRVAGSDVTWLEGHCISYGRHIPYLPLIEVVKQAFAVQETDDEEAVIERLTSGSFEWDDPRSTVPYLRFLLSLDPGDAAIAGMDPRERRAGILDALRALLIQVSTLGPLILVVEDLHWADEPTEQALSALMDVIASKPVLLLLTSRPGYTPGAAEPADATRLALVPLAASESADLVRTVLGADPPPELERLVADKAEGNPFYVEEVIRSLLETGVLARSNGSYRLERTIEDIRIPGTIQEVVLARVDRLEPPAKAALQLASVIGREFTLRLLERISNLESQLEKALGELKALELIYEKAYAPELAYMFKHALTHDVAYSTLLAERRRTLHRVVALAVEELFADRLAEHYETLAHHYYQAGEWNKALDYLSRAGDKAAAAFANQDALDYYARALEVCERLGEDVLPMVASLAPRRGHVNFAIGRFADAAADMERWLQVARRLEDRHLEGTALVYRGFSELFDHDKESAEATLRQVLAFAQGEGFEQVRALAHLQLGHIYVSWDRHAEAEPHLRFVDEHIDDLNDPFARGFWAWYASRMELWAGRLDVAVRKAKEGRTAAAGTVFNRLGGSWDEAHALATKGEYEAALRLLEETLAACHRVGHEIVRVRCLNTVGYVYGEICNLVRAMAWNNQGLQAALTAHAPVPEVEMNARLNLVENFLAQGRLAEAEEQFRIIEPIVRHPRPRQDFMRWRYGQRFLHDLGEYWLARGDPALARSLAGECLAWAERSGSRKNVVKARRLYGQVHFAEGRHREAGDELEAALELARQVNSPPQIWKTAVVLGDLREAQGRTAEGSQAYQEALAIVDAMAAQLTDNELRETFLSSADVQATRRLARARTAPN